MNIKHEKKMVEPNNNKLHDSKEKATVNGSTRLKTIGTNLIRVGIIISLLISVFLSFYFLNQRSENLTVVTLLLLILFIGIIALNIGILLLIYGLEKSKNLNIPCITVFVKNVKVYVILSLILANWTLSSAPFIVYLPFSLLFSLDPYGINFPHFQAYIFPFILRYDRGLSAIIKRYLSYGNKYILNLIGLIVVIFTLFLLMFQLRDLFREKKKLQGNYSPTIFWFELNFRLVLILLLAYETISPMWDSLFPNTWLSPSNNQELILLINIAITPLITLLCLIFLLFGSFRHSYFVINNYSFLKKAME